MATQMNPVTWFEIPVNNLDRAKRFYEDVFGVTLSLNDFGTLKMAWFPMKEGSAGATGTLVKAETYVPSHAGTMVYFSVDDIEDVLKRVSVKGGKIVNPKRSIGEYGFVAHFEDCEGNRVALHSMQ
ncbi:MAG: VOC family protein [Ignavibacteria bacterium]|nr:VOC family protein [Ignavibacteria bacterium]